MRHAARGSDATRTQPPRAGREGRTGTRSRGGRSTTPPDPVAAPRRRPHTRRCVGHSAFTPCTAYRVPCTVYFTPCNVHCVLYTVYPYSVYRKGPVYCAVPPVHRACITRRGRRAQGRSRRHPHATPPPPPALRKTEGTHRRGRRTEPCGPVYVHRPRGVRTSATRCTYIGHAVYAHRPRSVRT
jgi:hypothetical protein